MCEVELLVIVSDVKEGLHGLYGLCVLVVGSVYADCVM